MQDIQTFINNYSKQIKHIHFSPNLEVAADYTKYDMIELDMQTALFKELHKHQKNSPEYKVIKDILVMSHMRYVAKIACQANKSRTTPLEDLVSDGAMGLMRAVDNFDETKNVPFANYAFYWIKNKIDEGMAMQGSIIQYPTYLITKIKKYVRSVSKLANELNMDKKDIPIKLIAKNAGEKEETIATIHDLLNNKKVISLEEYEHKNKYRPTSDKVESDRSLELADMTQESIEEVSEQEELNAKIRNIVHKIGDPQLEELILEHYGLNTGSIESLSSIGRDKGVSREAMRQKKDKALKIMQEKGLLDQLRDLL